VSNKCWYQAYNQLSLTNYRNDFIR